MEFTFQVDCETEVHNKDTSEARLRGQLQAADSSELSGLCSDNDCSNFMYEGEACSSTNPNMMIVQFSMSFSTELIMHSSGVSLAPPDVFRLLILSEGKLDLETIAIAELVTETVEITSRYGCDRGMTLVRGDLPELDFVCAPCGKGHYIDNETIDCMLCPPGTYQDEQGQYECKPCGDDKTNYQYGNVEESSCTDICTAGQYRSGTTCKDCPRHSYQATPGLNFCEFCELGFKTATNKSTSETDCKEDCPAGQYRALTGPRCANCTRGTWRGSQDYDCRPCTTGYTTYEDKLATSLDDCEMEICDLGAYWNMSKTSCMECDLGEYQDEKLELSCKPCGGNLTTKQPKSTDKTDCTFYCTEGYEVESSVDKTCRPCARGYYKSNDDDVAKFEPCKKCPQDTTDDIASTSENDCYVPICSAGYYISDSMECEPCDVDFYSDVDMPYTDDVCDPCSCAICEPLGTRVPGANSSDMCESYCEAGFELIEGECEMCQRGFYKDNSKAATRFDACTPCPGAMITDEEGADNQSLCVIPQCNAGQYIFDNQGVYECRNCSADFYQEKDLPMLADECRPCPDLGTTPQGTKMGGQASVDACMPVCAGGFQFDVDKGMCIKCPIGQFKQASERFGNCENCLDDLFVTPEEGAVSNDECTLRDCGPGTYIHTNGQDCVNCSKCYWQDMRRQASCNYCGDELCTLEEQAKSASQCTIRCNAGFEGSEECVPCGDGMYKPKPGYGECIMCNVSFTSSPENRTACNLRNCTYGTYYVLNDDGTEDCLECDVGSFKDTVGNFELCQICDPSFTTDGKGQRECALRDCLPGTTLDNGECVECLPGFYKSGSGNVPCDACPDDRTTDGPGKTSQADCNIIICPAGEYRSPSDSGLCLPCPFNRYQPNVGATQCEPCAADEVTMQEASTSQDQCVPYCLKGRQYNATTKLCDLCAVGFYKEDDGNTLSCEACDEDFTTVAEGTSSIQGCNQPVCPAGTYTLRTSNAIVCTECDIGDYNPVRGQDLCEQCIGGRTTFFKGRKSFSDCFVKCQLGEGYNRHIAACSKCQPNFYNDLTGNNANLCKKCPLGTSNIAQGSTSCDYPDPNPPVIVRVNIIVILIFRVEVISCEDQYVNVATSAVNRKAKEVFLNEQTNRYNTNQRFCTDNCENMSVQRSTGPDSCRESLRKKRALHDIYFTATFFNASSVVQDTEDGNAEIPTEDALNLIILHNEDNLTPPEFLSTNGQFLNAVSITTQDVCIPGQVTVSNTCVDCPAGEYWENGVCIKCPADTYQALTGQLSCEDCPANTYHDLERQMSDASCQSPCVGGSYCNSRGKCVATGRRTATCSCYDDYQGARCEVKREPKSDMDVILGLAIGGGGGLLMIILAIVGIYKCLSSKDEKKKKSRYEEDPEYYHDPMYDNHTQSRLGAFPTVGYPALGYRPDPSIHEDSPYSAVYKNNAYVDPNKSGNEDTFVWQA